jgi:copper transport protein
VTSRILCPRFLAAVTIALGAVLLTAAPASAHATLNSTEPVGGTALERSPERVALRFSEAVQIPLGSIRVFASPSGKQVETGAARHEEGGRVVAVNLPKLDDGNFIVTWRVTSADAHPIHGAFTFTVGSSAGGAEDAALIEKLLASGSGSTTVGAVYAVVRFAAYAALVLLVGGFAFVALVWPAGAAEGRTRRVLWGAWLLAFVSTAVGIAVQGAYSAALPLSKVVSSTVLSGVLDERFGQVWTARLGILAVMAAVLVLLGHRADADADAHAGAISRPVLIAGGFAGTALILTAALAGHAVTQDLVALAVVSDVLHLLAVSLWLGGLALLAVTVLPRRVGDEMAAVVPRFSRLAFWSVTAILVTGSFQSWRQVRSTAALTDTTYGRLLIVKVVLFAVLVGLGGLSRRVVRARYRMPAPRLSFGPGTATDDPDPATVAQLRRAVGAETVIAVAVLAVTALLVNAQPARSALAQPFNGEMRNDMVVVNVTLDPAKAGPTDLHIYTLSPTGQQLEVQDLTARLTLPSDDVGPLTVAVERAGPGHFSAYDFNLPLRGDWTLEVKTLLSDIDEATLTTTIPVK